MLFAHKQNMLRILEVNHQVDCHLAASLLTWCVKVSCMIMLFQAVLCEGEFSLIDLSEEWLFTPNLIIYQKQDKKKHPKMRLQLRYVYALNLSILISAGKESNSDSPSTGEGRGKRPNLKSVFLHGGHRIVVTVVYLVPCWSRRKSDWMLCETGWKPRTSSQPVCRLFFLRVGLFENAALSTELGLSEA